MDIVTLILSLLGLAIAAMAWLASRRGAAAAERSADAAERSAEASGASARAAQREAEISGQQLEVKIRPHLKARPVAYRANQDVEVELWNDGSGPAKQISLRGLKGQLGHPRVIGPLPDDVLGHTSRGQRETVPIPSLDGEVPDPDAYLLELSYRDELDRRYLTVVSCNRNSIIETRRLRFGLDPVLCEGRTRVLR